MSYSDDTAEFFAYGRPTMDQLRGRMSTITKRLDFYHATCPTCGSADTVYRRDGDELVCRDCWQGKEDAYNPASDPLAQDRCFRCGDEVSQVWVAKRWVVKCVRGHIELRENL